MTIRSIAAAAALFACTLPAFAQNCTAEISGNDAMQFDKKALNVLKGCKDFTVTLKHSGKLPKAAMGHNWVLTKTSDVQGAATDGLAAGLDKQYVKPGDTRVIAHTKVLGPGETDSVKFSAAKLAAGESYTFFCSFPGHWTVMKGTLQVEK